MKEIIQAYLKIAKENGLDISEKILIDSVLESREEDVKYINSIKSKLNNNPSKVFLNSTIIPDDNEDSSVIEKKLLELLFEYLKMKM